MRPIKEIPCLFILALLLYLSCSSEALTGEDPEAREAIKRSVKLYSSHNWEIRKMAINRVSVYSGTVYSRNVVLLLLKATDDTHALVRVEALKALTRIKTESAHSRIREMALNDRKTIVRWTAYQALEVYKSAEDESAFITGYGDSEWLIREAAIRGLLKIDDETVQSRNRNIIIAAVKDSNISVRINALNHLRYRDPDIYREIAAIINNKKTGITLLKAALTAVSGYRLDKITRGRLVRLLTHSNKEVRILALRALKKDEELKKTKEFTGEKQG